MSTLHQLQNGIAQAWDSLVDGWHQLYRRASNALTRFDPRHGLKAAERDDATELALRSSGWGLLAAELFEDDDRVVVRLEIPGMERDEFRLDVIGHMLVVRGEKRLQRERSQGRYQVTECAYGSFERAIELPDEVDADKAEAVYRRGILRVELPKRRSASRRQIKVQAG